MEKVYNQIEKIIKIIGVIVFICGVIASIPFIFEAISDSDFVGFIVSVAIIVGSFITAICFIGFSVIIEKLKESVNIQKSILQRLNDKIINNNADEIKDIINTVDAQEISGLEKEENQFADLIQKQDKVSKKDNFEGILVTIGVLVAIFLLFIIAVIIF